MRLKVSVAHARGAPGRIEGIRAGRSLAVPARVREVAALVLTHPGGYCRRHDRPAEAAADGGLELVRLADLGAVSREKRAFVRPWGFDGSHGVVANTHPECRPKSQSKSTKS